MSVFGPVNLASIQIVDAGNDANFLREVTEAGFIANPRGHDDGLTIQTNSRSLVS